MRTCWKGLKFTLREIALVILLLCVSLAWLRDRSSLAANVDMWRGRAQYPLSQMTVVAIEDFLIREGYAVEHNSNSITITGGPSDADVMISNTFAQ
ncbi:hypothetical protein [Anatilimnocola floriformis]|uniref:hypothetical protein n=1 Tax=Anatilimnocola floriformis TaxID=2948575 RepID=UPI0020C476BE|nr:hypothetical protein [Anatilimnocola floriformis]